MKNRPSVRSAPIYCLYLSAHRLAAWRGRGGGGGGWIACFPPWLSHSVSRLLGGEEEEGGEADRRERWRCETRSPFLLPTFIPPPPPPPPAMPPRQRASETPSNLIPSLLDWKPTPRKGWREGRRRKRRGGNRAVEKGEIPELNLRGWKVSQEREN